MSVPLSLHNHCLREIWTGRHMRKFVTGCKPGKFFMRAVVDDERLRHAMPGENSIKSINDAAGGG